MVFKSFFHGFLEYTVIFQRIIYSFELDCTYNQVAKFLCFFPILDIEVLIEVNDYVRILEIGDKLFLNNGVIIHVICKV